MPSTLSRTYGKKAQVKRKTSPSDDEDTGAKRRKVTPIEEEEGSAPNVEFKGRSYSPPTKSTKPPQMATPTKVTKRMLGRSKTESSIDSQPSTSMASRTSSLPVIPSSSPQSPLESHSQEQERRPTQATSTSTPRVKRTYAGQSRSFLISLPASDFNPSGIPGLSGETQEDDFHEPESYSSLRLRLGLDGPEDDPVLPLPPTPSRSKSKVNKSSSNNSTPLRKGKGKSKPNHPAIYLPPNMMNPLKSITELRSKGESRRFLDEVGYLFEGMDPSSSVPLKRSSASEITTQLCEDEFARKAKAADFYQKAWDVFLKTGAGRGEDKILDILLVFLVALIARNADTLLDLAVQEPSAFTSTSDTEYSPTKNKGKGKEKAELDFGYGDTLISILFFILKNSADIDPLAIVSPLHSATDIEFKQIGLSKKDKFILSSIYSSISTKSNLFPSDTPITTTLLISHILQTLPPSLLPETHISDLLHSLRSLLHTSLPPNEPFDGTYPIDVDDDDDDEQGRREPQYECIKNHLLLLDMYLLGQWKSEAGTGNGGLSEINAARDEWFVSCSIAAAIRAKMKLRKDGDKDDASVESASECLGILLRVLVNLTHGDPNWTQSVLSNEFAVPFIVHLLASSFSSCQASQEDVKPKLEDDVEPPEPFQKAASHNAWDHLCLALGLLTNLVQSVPEFKNILRRTKVSPGCTLANSSCTKQCTCPGPIGSLELLARIYNLYSPSPTMKPSLNGSKRSNIKREELPPDPQPTSHSREESEETADTSLILGTLSILFGLLMSSSPQNQSIILSNINPTSTSSGAKKLEELSSSTMTKIERGKKRMKLERLAEQAKDFVLVYDVMSSGSGDRERNGMEEEVEETRSAKEVLKVLERLRDEY